MYNYFVILALNKQYLQYTFPFFFVVLDVRHLIYQKDLYMMSFFLWGGNVFDDIPVSSSVLFLLLESSVPVKDCTSTVISLQ